MSLDISKGGTVEDKRATMRGVRKELATALDVDPNQIMLDESQFG